MFCCWSSSAPFPLLALFLFWSWFAPCEFYLTLSVFVFIFPFGPCRSPDWLCLSSIWSCSFLSFFLSFSRSVFVFVAVFLFLCVCCCLRFWFVFFFFLPPSRRSVKTTQYSTQPAAHSQDTNTGRGKEEDGDCERRREDGDLPFPKLKSLCYYWLWKI